MKKSYLAVLATLLLVGCGETSTPPSPYIVKVVYPDGTPVNGGVSVEWCTDSTCSQSVVVNSEGTASSELDEDTYVVHIGNLPEGYAYDPNAYVVDSDNRSTTITLSSISGYESGDGTKYISGEELGPYVVKEGVYNVNLSNDNEYLYYAFTPSTPGKFFIESWSLVKDSKIDYYGNNPQLIPENPIDSDDNSGGENNFKYEFEITSDAYGSQSSGYTMIFGITVNSKNKNAEFPINIKCIEEYDFGVIKEDDSITNVESKAELKIYDKPTDTKLVTMPFDGTKEVVYSENDGYYHIDSIDGPVLMANISSLNDTIITTFTAIQDENPTALIFNEKNYNNFIDTYEKFVNDDGVCPVNNELKAFLEEFITCPVGEFLLMWLEVEYNENYSWLAYCSYYNSIYEKLTSTTIEIDNALTYGEIVASYLIEVNASSSVNLTIPFVEDGVNEYTIQSTNPNAKLSYSGQTYSSENGFSVVVSSLNGDITFEISSLDGNAENIGLKIGLGDLNIYKVNIGNNNISVDNIGKEVMFIANESCNYKFSANKGSNTILVINNTTYDSTDASIEVEIKLNLGERLKFIVKNTNSSESTISFKISKISNAIVGANDISFTGTNIIYGVELSFEAEENALYAFRVSSYYSSTFSLTINGTKYNTSSDGFIASLNLNTGDKLKLFAENDSLEESYVTLNIDKVNYNLSIGDTTITVTNSNFNGACVLFTAPSDGTYVISTSTYKGTVGGKLIYGDDITNVASSSFLNVSLNPITLVEGQQIVIFVMYEQTNWQTGITPESFDVIVNVETQV